MKGYLFDENVPSKLRFRPKLPIHSVNRRRMTDSDVWNLAVRDELVIVSKDVDFSDRIVKHNPPPWVVHIRFGNLRRAAFHEALALYWPKIETLLKTHKLVNVYL